MGTAYRYFDYSAQLQYGLASSSCHFLRAMIVSAKHYAIDQDHFNVREVKVSVSTGLHMVTCCDVDGDCHSHLAYSGLEKPNCQMRLPIQVSAC